MDIKGDWSITVHYDTLVWAAWRGYWIQSYTEEPNFE